MSKAFLSHSSVDKEFVKPIAELFGKDRCIYDELTFEEGMKPIDQIFENLDNTDIFVFFISDSSLNSNWVRFELNSAVKKLYSQPYKIEQIYPIIIDDIKYTDDRIPDFLKNGMDSYNLRHIKNYKVAYRKILNQFIRLRMKQDPIYKEKLNIFYGRDIEIKKFKDKYDDYSRSPMKCLVVSGIEGIGRKSYIKAALKNAKIVKEYYSPITISLNKSETIDDLILKISELGFGDYNISDINSVSIEVKIEILAELLKEVQKYNEHIFIDDDLCIIGLDQNIKYWFEKALKKIRNEIVVSIVTNIKLDFMRYKNNSDIFFIEIAELHKYERSGLLRTYSVLESILFSREDIEYLQGSLTGYPPQIEYCVDLAKSNSVEFVKSNPNLIVQRSSKRAADVLRVIIDEKYKTQSYGFLSFLSNYDTVPIRIINDLFKINLAYKEIFIRFNIHTICRYFGASNEYVKVNNVIQDYIQRNKFDLPDDIKAYLKSSIDQFNENLNDPHYTDFLDFSELNYYIKENLKNDLYVPEKFLYSTVFLRTVVELYNDKKSDRVINIVKSLKENGYFELYDLAIKKQIQFYYCLSLARKRAKEFVLEVEFFSKGDKSYYFLNGFNERLSGNIASAEKNYRQVLKMQSNHVRAKRELVMVYLLLDEYDLALDLAEENYRNDPENIYQIQAYFECIIQKEKISSKQRKDIDTILTTAESLFKERDFDIYYQINAKYNLHINRNKYKALSFLEEGLEKFRGSIYLAIDLFDIYERYSDKKGMEKTLKLIQDIVDDNRSSYIPALIKRKFLLDAHKGKSRTVIEIELNRNSNLSKTMKDNILQKIDKITSKLFNDSTVNYPA